MPRNSEIIIVGAGVIGSSIAYHLSSYGISNITVLDSGPAPGSGSTSKATGGIRSQFGSEINIRLSQLSLQKIMKFKDEHGIDPGYLKAGYLFLAQTAVEMKNLTLANSLQQKTGVIDAALVTVDDIERLNPYINMEKIIGGSFCQSDGFIEPMNILSGFVSSSEKKGVKYIYGEQVSKIKLNGSRVENIETSSGTFSADIYINAAGAWAGWLAGLALEYLPVRHLKRQVCRIKETGTLPDNIPMTVWVDPGFHFRMKDDHLILLLPDTPENNYNYDVTVEQNWIDRVMKVAVQKIPAANTLNADTENSWAGLYEMSPDEHLILGKSGFLDNFYYANGSSGHGVMHSPAIGELLANIICNKPNEIDTGILSPERFSEGKLIDQIHFF